LFIFAPANDAGGPGSAVAALCDWLEHDLVAYFAAILRVRG